MNTTESQAAATMRRDAQILSQLQDSVICMDAEGIITYWNEGATRLFGWSAEEMMGSHYLKRLEDGEIRQAVGAIFQNVIGGEGFFGECEDMRKDRSHVWVIHHANPVRDSAGKVIKVISLSTDISERKQAEIAMRRDAFILSQFSAKAVSADISERRRKEATTRRDAHILSQLQDSVLCMDINGIITYWNEAATRLFGWSSDEMVGKHYLIRLPEGDIRQAVGEIFQNSIDGQDFYGEREDLRKDGSRVWVETRITRFNDALGRVIGVISISRDITERREAEVTIRRDALILSQLQHAVTYINAEYRVLYWNEASENLFRCKKEDMLGQHIGLRVPVEVRPQLVQTVQRILAGEASADEVEEYRHDGSRVWVYRRANPVRDSTGKVIGAVSVATDISERKHAEATMRRDAYILSQLRDSVICTDMEGNVTYWNDGATRLFGLSARQMVGQPIFHRFPPGSERDAARQRSQTIIEQGETLSEREECRADGTTFWYESRSVRLRDANGYAIGIIGIARNITERKLAMIELVKAKEAAETAAKAKSEFLAVISHEIRTPLNPILAATQLLLDEECAPEQRELFQVIQNAGEHLLTLLTDILDLAKMEARRSSLTLEPFRLEELVRGVMDIKREEIRTKGLSPHQEIDDDLAFCYIGDERRLRQILLNLIGNAVKFTSRGSVTVRIQRLAMDGQRDQLKIAVRDTGIGLSSEHARRIFEPFYQVDSSSSRRYEGAGLGLAICQRLLDMMEGEMGVESQLGQGATFWFSVWLERGQMPIHGDTPAPMPDHAGRHRVLLVEDDQRNRAAIVTLLERANCVVSTAPTARNAMALFHPGTFDLILMDLLLPDLDGAETARRLRKREHIAGAKHTPIIAYSANSDLHDLESMKRMGIDDLLATPIQREDILKILQEHISAKKSKTTPVVVRAAKRTTKPPLPKTKN